MRLSINREDILMSLDGIVYLEGRSGERIAEAVKRNKRDALGMLRRLAPDLSARQLTIDSAGRVRIKHPKFAELALLLAQEEEPSTTEFRTVVPRPGDDVRPADDDGRAELDFLCPGDGQIDLVCGEWQEGDEGCDVNFACGWST
jgi:hypothetical protein